MPPDAERVPDPPAAVARGAPAADNGGSLRGHPVREGRLVSYVIAAYAVVIGTLAGYGLWLRAQRRALMREAEARRSHGAGEPGLG